MWDSIPSPDNGLYEGGEWRAYEITEEQLRILTIDENLSPLERSMTLLGSDINVQRFASLLYE